MATATATTSSKPKLDPISIALRNASILKMNLEGKSNQTIAECVGLHPGNVAKIIKRAKELLPTAIMEHPKIKEAMEQLPLPLPSCKATVKANGHAKASKGKVRKSNRGKSRRKRQGMSLLDAACIVLRRSKTMPGCIPMSWSSGRQARSYGRSNPARRHTQPSGPAFSPRSSWGRERAASS